MIYLFGLSIASFLLVLILLKKDKTHADYILAAWMSVLVIHLTLFFFDYKGISYRYPHLLGLSLAVPILHGGFLYFYTLALIRKTPVRTQSILLHLIPFVLLVILAIPFYRLTGAEKIEVYKNQGRGYEWYSQIQMIAFLVAGFTYSVVVIWEIRKYRRKVLNNFSNVDRKMLRWLEYLAIGLGFIWLLSAFFNDQIIFIGVVLFVFFIGFFGISQYPAFYSLPSASEKPGPALTGEWQETLQVDGEKYSRSGLSEHDASHVMTLLETAMKTRKPFANPNLTLNDLASSINVSPNHLSQVINTLAGKSFYHYVNAYRIDEFLKLMALPQNRKFTYWALAHQCGFSSKTTFNKYFKLQMGKTPSDYLSESIDRPLNSG
ncbi:MAG TPA: helix-turn-helix transcriptional regulator [Cyclobacteriaceae bacterium]|nr:helix-turn-helix transcriptional regulator [Cyclobacteriaceae bacterium]